MSASSELASNSSGLVFSISPAKKQVKKKDDDDDENILTLAPFTKPPKINFGQLKENDTVQRSVLIINPQEFDLDLNVTNNDLNINNISLTIDKGQDLNLKITWNPDKAGNYKFGILFEVTNSARLKFLVHAFGICIKPEDKKPRKPFNMLQPLRDKKEIKPARTLTTKAPVTKPEPSSSTTLKYNVKSTTIIKKTSTITQSKCVLNQTVTIGKIAEGNKENKKQLDFPLEPSLHQKQLKTQTIQNARNTAPFTGSTIQPAPVNQSLYSDIDEKKLDSTPKYVEPVFNYQSHATPNFGGQSNNVQLTPKLSDFLKPSNFSFESEHSNSTTSSLTHQLTNTTTTTTTTLTKIAATKLIDISIEQDNPLNKKTSINFMATSSQSSQNFQQQQTPQYSKFNSSIFLNESIIQYAEKDQVTSTANRGSRNYIQLVSKAQAREIPSMNKDYLYEDFDLEPTKDDGKFIKYVTICQKALRMKLFRKHLDKLRLKSKKKSSLLASSQMLAKELEIINRKEEEFLLKQQLEKQRIELKLIEMEKFEREKKERYLSCVIKCQRAFRMKMFRKYLQAYRNDLMLKVTLCVQRKWRLIKFRRCVRDIKMGIEYQNELVKYTIICQKSIRMKLFRKNLIRLRQEKQNLTLINQKAALIQKTWRMYKFRSKMTEYRNSAIKIQTWYRTFVKQRLHFIALKTHTIKIQKLFREKQIQRNKSALVIQSFWKMSLERRKFNNQKNSALIIQKWFRSKTDRIRFLKLKRSISNIQLKCKELIRVRNKAASTIQLAYRMYKFRSNMLKFKTAAITIQTWTRSMKLRFEFLEKKRLIIEIQKLYKQVYLPKRNSSAIVIQNSWKCFKARQQLAHLKHEKKVQQAATVLQKNWRSFKARQELKQLKRAQNAAIVIQKHWRGLKARRELTQLKEENNLQQSAIIIQKNWKGFIARKRLILLKNEHKKHLSAIVISKYWKGLIARRELARLKETKRTNQAAMVLQKHWRGLKARRELSRLKIDRKFKLAAILIQKNWRGYKTRKEVAIIREEARVQKAVVLIQNQWRGLKARKELKALKEKKKIEISALVLQKHWRGLRSRKELRKIKEEKRIQAQIVHEQEKLTKCAIKIQAYWRGFRVRKQTIQAFVSIRNRLSIYQTNTSSILTLGFRIKNSLKILKYPCVPIQQIIMALIDMHRVTGLSPECCLIFTREGAIDILYNFIQNCNRSVPHMDLIKFCLQIFINLSKYSQTVEYILQPSGSLSILLNLLQAYQSSNPNIFMDACIIFTLLAQNESIKSYMLNKTECFIRKLVSIHSVLERRASLREKQTSRSSLGNKEQLNSTLGLSSSMLGNQSKKAMVIQFTLTPGWNLVKTTPIELVDPIGALEYLLDTLGVSYESSLAAASSRTPKKAQSLLSLNNNSAKKNRMIPDYVAPLPIKASKIPVSKNQPVDQKKAVRRLYRSIDSKPLAIEEETNFVRMEELTVYNNGEFELEGEQESVCGNESIRSVCSVSTIRSIGNLNNERPKLNSTAISLNTTTTTTVLTKTIKKP